MKRWYMALVLLFAWTGAAGAQAQLMGTLSNFDVNNQTGSTCDGFEITLHGVSPTDVYHTYKNPDFGSPSVNASGSDTVVVYSGHQTAPDTVEHFGVSFSGTSPASTRYRWTSSGQDCSGSPASSDVPLPDLISTDNGSSLSTDLVNDSPDGQPIWVQRRVLSANRAVSLEELMTTSPSYTDGTEIDSSPQLLDPGQSLTQDDSLDSADNVQSVVIATDVYQDNSGSPGSLMGTIINAAITNPGQTSACTNLQSITLARRSGRGGRFNPAGKVTLAQRAPSGGVVVLLASDNPSAASVPTSVTVAAGSRTGKFTVRTHPVSERDTVDITAGCGSIDKSVQLTLNP